MPAIVNHSQETVLVSSIEPHPKNPRHGDVGAVSASIEAHGFYGSIVVQKSTGHILAGNHRWRAAKAVGFDSIPVTFVDVDDETALRILLADNRTSDIGSYDDEALIELLQGLQVTERGLDGLGYDSDDLDNLLHDIGLASDRPAGAAADPEPTAADAAQKKWNVKLGDVWDAGAHVLKCGDSAQAGVWDGVVDGEAQCVWTDPPYGVAYAGDVFAQAKTGAAARVPIKADSDSSDDVGKLFAQAVIDNAPLAAGGALYAAGPAGPLLKAFLVPLVDAGWLRQCLVWVKHRMTPGRSDYHYQHEMILYGWKPGAAHTWHGDRKQTTILEHDRPHASPEHPTMKPVSLIVDCLQNSCQRGDVVLDPFCGSGSTLLACEHLGLAGRGIELEPKYVAVTLQRLVDVGLEPVRRGSDK